MVTNVKSAPSKTTLENRYLLGNKWTNAEIGDTECLETKNAEVRVDTRRIARSPHASRTGHMPRAVEVLTDVFLLRS